MPAPLAASFEELCKETAVEEFVLRFLEQWKCIRRSVGKYIYFFILNLVHSQKIPISAFETFFGISNRSKHKQGSIVMQATQRNIHVTNLLINENASEMKESKT